MELSLFMELSLLGRYEPVGSETLSHASAERFACSMLQCSDADQGLNHRNDPEPLLSVIEFFCGSVRSRLSAHKHRFCSTPDSH